MKDQISKRDWETISAYLDGQLSTRKQSRFEVRLQQEPYLQQAFEEIRKTRQLLHNTPSLRAPRNFVLTPEMAGQQRQLPRLSPFFGWASAVASFLLVLVLVGDIFSVGGALPVAINAVPQQVDRAVTNDFGRAQESADVEGESAAMKGEAAGGYSQAVEAESPEDEVQLEVASAPEVEVAATEPAPAEESEPEPTKDVEIIVSGTGADDVVGTPDEPLGAAPVAQGTAAAFMLPSETVEVYQQEELPEVLEEGESIAAVITSTATATPMAVSADEQIIEDSLLEEATQLPAEKALPVVPQVEPSATVADLVPMEKEIEIDSTETEVPVEEKPQDILLGAEVILALLAVGLGMSWLYMRRRGG